MIKKLNINKILIGFMLVILIANMGLLFNYIFFDYKNYFHSDSAAKVLLAREIYESGSLFPADWNYVNGDLFVVFGHLFIVPLLVFLPAGFAVHAISGAIFAVLIIYGIWLLTALADIPVWRRLVVVAVIASGISGFTAENLFGQVSYGVIIFFCCFKIYFASKYISVEGVKKIKWAILFVILILLAYWANPKRAVVTYSLPLIGSLFWLISSSDAPDRHKLWVLIGLSLIGAVGGSILHAATIVGVNNVLGAANARWLSYELVLRNIALTLKGVYAQLGGLPLADASLFSRDGLYAGMRFGVASLAIVITPMALRRAVNSGNKGLQLLALFAGFSFSSALFLQITTSIPDMSDPIQSSRYLVPGVVLCLIILLSSKFGWSRPPILVASVSLVTVVLISSAYGTYRLSGLNSEQILAQPGQMNSDRNNLVAFLAEKGLQYGYASYWNAGAVSVLSDEKSIVRQIQFHNGLPVPMKHLSSNRWYRPTAWRGKTFILLQENEVALVDWKKLARMGCASTEQYRIHGFAIFVFAENIARCLPGWDTRYEESASFLPSEGALSQVGHLIKDENGLNDVLVADKGEEGALYYGPYVDVDAGRYRAVFDVRAESEFEPVVRLDVAAAPDQKIFGELVLDGSDEPQEIIFTLSEKRTMEFRVWALGRGHITFRGVSIERIGKKID